MSKGILGEFKPLGAFSVRGAHSEQSRSLSTHVMLARVLGPVCISERLAPIRVDIQLALSVCERLLPKSTPLPKQVGTMKFRRQLEILPKSLIRVQKRQMFGLSFTGSCPVLRRYMVTCLVCDCQLFFETITRSLDDSNRMKLLDFSSQLGPSTLDMFQMYPNAIKHS